MNTFFFMKFMSYKCEFVGKINEIHILINEKSKREILGSYKLSRDTSRTEIEPGFKELNPSEYDRWCNNLQIFILLETFYLKSRYCMNLSYCDNIYNFS